MPAAAPSKVTPVQWMVVCGVGVLVLVGGGWVTYKMIIDPPPKIVEKPFVPPDLKIKRNLAPESQVALAPKPKRLFYQFFEAVGANDRKTVVKCCEITEDKIDLILTEERVAIMKLAREGQKFAIEKEEIKDDTATYQVMFQNVKGLDVMELLLTMKKKGGPEDWQITDFQDKWMAASGHVAENKFVALGADRKFAIAPKVERDSFKKIPEGEPTTLDWFPETTDAQKSDIEKHLKALEDENNPARATAASQALIQMGKLPIPRLLTELGKLDPKKEDDNKRANTIDRTLAALTDQEMGYNVSEMSELIPPLEARRRAIRRWFGWWKLHSADPLPKRNAPADEK